MSNQFGLDEISQKIRDFVLESYREGKGIESIVPLVPIGLYKVRRVIREAGIMRMPRGNQFKHGPAKNGQKTCITCNHSKPISEFGSHCSTRDRLRPECKPCHVEKNHWGAIASRYGLTRDQYEAKLRGQNGVCCICGSAEQYDGKNRLAVDHDHASGTVRGLLCSRCNLVLGKLEDSADLCGRMQAYLLEHQQIHKENV